MDLAFRRSTREDLPCLKTLWKEAFHDDDVYIDNFFEVYYRPSLVFVAEESAEIVGMCSIFSGTFHRKKVEEHPFAYLYGVATKAEQQGKGVARQLLEFVGIVLEKEGYHGLTTVPATESLHKFFHNAGFQESFLEYRQQITFPYLEEEHGLFAEISPAQYAEERQAFLEEQDFPWFHYQEEGYRYQASLGKLIPPELFSYPSSGGLFLYQHEGTRAVFALEKSGKTSYIMKEYLGSYHILHFCVGKIWDVFSMKCLEIRSPLPFPDWQPVEFARRLWFPHMEPMDRRQGGKGYHGLGFD